MGAFKSTRRLLIGVSVLTVALLLVYGFFLHTIFDTNRELRTLEADVTSKSEQQEHFQSIRNVLEDTINDRAVLESRLVKDEDVVVFIEQIEDIGRVSGAALDVRSVDVMVPEGATLFEWLELTIEVEGSWSEVYRFSSLLEHMPVILSLKQATLRVEAEDSNNGSLRTWHGTFGIQVTKKKALES